MINLISPCCQSDIACSCLYCTMEVSGSDHMIRILCLLFPLNKHWLVNRSIFWNVFTAVSTHVDTHYYGKLYHNLYCSNTIWAVTFKDLKWFRKLKWFNGLLFCGIVYLLKHYVYKTWYFLKRDNKTFWNPQKLEPNKNYFVWKIYFTLEKLWQC